MDQEFEIQKRIKGDIVILDIHGNLTIGVPEQLLKDSISELVSRHKTKVILDLLKVEFMDSSGVGALVKSYTSLTNSGGRLKLMHLNKMARHSLNVTGLLGIFETFDDEAQAVASF